MKTVTIREAADRREPRSTRTTARTTTHASTLPRSQPDWVFPGMTRAQMRDLVIEQIG
jgi:hypothetical protein